MDFQIQFLISFTVLLYFLGVTLAASPLNSFCSLKNGNYTQNSTYQKNLNSILSSLSSNISDDGYYSGHIGENSDRVNAYAMCRGDIQLDTCRACINNSTRDVVKACANQKEAVIWYDYCMLRYSNNAIVGILNTDLVFFMWSMQNVTNVTQFNEVLEPFMVSQRDEVASGTTKKFATGNRTVTGVQTIYLLQQCTPDLSANDCKLCLSRGAADISGNFNGRIGGRVIGPSCNFRYEISNFFFDNSPVVTAPSPSIEGSIPTISPVAQPPPSLAQPPPSLARSSPSISPSPPSSDGAKDSTSILLIVLSILIYIYMFLMPQ